MKGPVFFCDDDASIRTSLQQALELEDVPVRCFATGQGLLEALEPDWPGVVISDINMPVMDGLALMHRVHETDHEIPVILLTGHGDISMAVSAMRQGAYDFIEKPYEADLITDVVRRGTEKRALTLENRQLKNQLKMNAAPGPRLLGKTPPMLQLFSILEAIADAPADVLLHGDTGTGKDLVARWLHENSRRVDHNFVAINCGAVPENLIESELFGHEAGAFTGANKQRIGKFEYANGGTVFLDEIESMPLQLQVKLLRVLEERKIERLGSNKSVPIDIRVIAATKTDLQQLSTSGQFRSDLYYRLNIVKVDIPSLRERENDIPLLFQHFSLIAAARYQREIIPPPSSRMARLMQHPWPGNVRELRNLAERYVLLGEHAFEQMANPFEEEVQGRQTVIELVENYESQLINAALAQHQGSIKDALVSLGLPRKTLYDKMKKYGLDKDDYKDRP